MVSKLLDQQQEDLEMVVPQSDFVDCPVPLEEVEEEDQPMEVEQQQQENPNPSEDHCEDALPRASRFRWTIENFSLSRRKLISPEFSVAGYNWRLLVFPRGNLPDGFLSMYLAVSDSSSLPYGWSFCAKFTLAVVDQFDEKYSVKSDDSHRFSLRERDWGFPRFMPLRELHGLDEGYIVDDRVVVEAEVVVPKARDYWGYDSKKETGFVGLKNQGATCYMNSLLQMLYHIPYFRKAVYHMPTTENDAPAGSIPLALKTLFYKLQYTETSVATRDLTKSFGWETHDSFMQQDVQELNRVLCEKLEEKMKGTEVEGTIQKLFGGHQMNYIECINVDFKSTRKESFYDIQLDVKGCNDVYASFNKYVEIERLEGDNKYQAEEHGLQDAKKGVLFTDFPPVLQLHFKRFEYDVSQDTMVKINDRYEFPLQLDLDRENGKYLSPDADKSVRNLYTLHSVLVHSGGVRGGHYYAFIRPSLSDQWYKFNDDIVTKEDVNQALEEQFGGEEVWPVTNESFNNNSPIVFTRSSNAYMLVYIRESDKDNVNCDVDEKDIAEHLWKRLEKEKEEEEEKRRLKAEAHLYMNVNVARDEDLREQIGKEIYFDLVDFNQTRSFRVENQMPFNLFKEEVAKEFGVPVEYQRFWLWRKRSNRTYRPLRPLTPQEEACAVGQIREGSTNSCNPEFNLFLEVEYDKDLRPVPLPKISEEDILVFFKLYDPEKSELRYVGRCFVKGYGKQIEIQEKLNELAGFSTGEDIRIFDEVMFDPDVMCQKIPKTSSFHESEIGDGDIICFQKHLSPEQEDGLQYPDVASFLDYIKNRQVIHFRRLESPGEDDFCLELVKNDSYDDVVVEVADKLGLDDPSKVRLTPHDCYSEKPKPNSIKYQAANLLDMLLHNNQLSDILYYEVLEIPLPELQSLKTLEVAFYPTTKGEVSILNFRLPKRSTLEDLLKLVETKVELSEPKAKIRFLHVINHKIFKIFSLKEKIGNIAGTLRAEEIPEEEKNLGPTDLVVHVYHFTLGRSQYQQEVQNFGDPFFLVIHQGETLAEVKPRIQKRLGVSDEEFSKWKFALISMMGPPEYVEDDIVMFNIFQRKNVYGPWERYLGLEHSVPSRKRTNQNRDSYEHSSVRIYN
ncbi:OLC1v1030510C1 [Oldenlandia corymbosa var. corymbosa]|uniref:ubiquitinyl hydrolase 1 n=1 Tax=Oldenlandia corymbosa var. corymbosa TaxID=529605 RepID=A0AAV1CJ78_OLDCO|nr:OLC1v1030510C1 [Oldenlandia corymbosa var. corymbosa]